MILQTTTSGVAAAVAACIVATGLAACVVSRDAVADAPASLRIRVELVRGSEDADAIAAEATRIAGIPVTYAAATSVTRHALALHCGSAGRCDAAIARLRAAGAIYHAVERDDRKVPAAS